MHALAWSEETISVSGDELTYTGPSECASFDPHTGPLTFYQCEIPPSPLVELIEYN